MSAAVTAAGVAAIAVLFGTCATSLARTGDGRATLYRFEADGGRLHATGGRDGEFVLVLDNAGVVGHQKLRRFVHDWKGNGFRRNPPSAAVVVANAPEENDVQIVELRHPRLLAGGDLRFRVHADKADGALQRFADDADRRIRPTFGEVRLFIDPTRSAFVGVTARNLPPIATQQALVVTFTNATFQPPGAQGITVGSDTAIGVDLRDNFLKIQNLGFHEGYGSSGFKVTTADPFLTGSVSLPAGVTGTILTGASSVFPLKAGPFKIGYE